MAREEREPEGLELKLGFSLGFLGMVCGAVLGWFVFAPLLAERLRPLSKKLGDETLEHVVTKQHRPGFLDSEDGQKMLSGYEEHRRKTDLEAARIPCVIGGGALGGGILCWLGIFVARMIEHLEYSGIRRQMRDHLRRQMDDQSQQSNKV